MSAETDFRAVLTGYAPLMALLAGEEAIAQNMAAQGVALPVVVFTSQHAPEFGLDNTLLADQVTFTVECWADTAAAADAVADQVAAALLAEAVVCTSRASTADAENGLDGTVLTAEWWAT